MPSLNNPFVRQRAPNGEPRSPSFFPPPPYSEVDTSSPKPQMTLATVGLGSLPVRRGTVQNTVSPNSPTIIARDRSRSVANASAFQSTTNQGRHIRAVDRRYTHATESNPHQDNTQGSVLLTSWNTNTSKHQKNSSLPCPTSGSSANPLERTMMKTTTLQATPTYDDLPPTPVYSPRSSSLSALENNGMMGFTHSPRSEYGLESPTFQPRAASFPTNSFTTAAVADRLPISPPTSPDSPALGPGRSNHSSFDYGNSNGNLGIRTEGLGISSLKVTALKALGMNSPKDLFPRGRSHAASASLDQNSSPISLSSGSPIMQRIQDLEEKNQQLESENSLNGARVEALRKSHAGAIASLLEVHAQEIAAIRKSARVTVAERPKGGVHEMEAEVMEHLKRKECEIQTVLEGKERELEMCRRTADGYKVRMLTLERQMEEREGNLTSMQARLAELEAESKLVKNTSDEVAGLELQEVTERLVEEIRLRKTAEREVEIVVARARSEAEEFMAMERAKDRESRERIHKEYEQSLEEERRRGMDLRKKSKDDLDYVVQEEQKRRAELNWGCQEKIDKIEKQWSAERADFNNRLDKLRKDKEIAEVRIKELSEEREHRRLSVATQRSGNDELVTMVQKVNSRLAEEKKKNKHLETTMSQITEEAWQNVSQTKHEVQKLKNIIEDKETRIKNLEFELMVTKREKSEFEVAWKSLQDENYSLQQAILARDDNPKQRDSSMMGNKHQSDEIHDEILMKLSEGSSRPSSSSNTSDKDDANNNPAALQEVIENLQRDIKLYRSDIRAYKKDVKIRDKKIHEQQLRLVAMTNEISELRDDSDLLGGFPQPPSSRANKDIDGNISEDSHNNIHEENDKLRKQLVTFKTKYKNALDNNQALKRKYDAVSGQQTVLLSELEKKIARLKKEKEMVENVAAKQVKQIQRSFLQFSQVAAAGVVAVPAPQQLQERFNLLSSPPQPPSRDSITLSTSPSSEPGHSPEIGEKAGLKIDLENPDTMRRPSITSPLYLSSPNLNKYDLPPLPSPPPPPPPAKEYPINRQTISSLNERTLPVLDKILPTPCRRSLKPGEEDDGPDVFEW